MYSSRVGGWGGFKIGQIDQLLITFHANDQFEYIPFYSVRLTEAVSKETLLASWSNEGYEVFWIDHSGGGHPWPLDENILQLNGKYYFETTQLESVPDRRPTEILPIVWLVEVYQVNP